MYTLRSLSCCGGAFTFVMCSKTDHFIVVRQGYINHGE